MCIIAAKPAGVPMPDAAALRAMWDNNPDGAGLMYAHNGRVTIDKGYMTWESWQAALAALCASQDVSALPVVLHCRIRTHGRVSPECCHPFPISGSLGMLRKLHCTAPVGVAHNGVIPGSAPPKGASDTMDYVTNILAPLNKALPRWYKDIPALELVRNTARSKLAILTGAGELITVGAYQEQGGVLYSNDSYTPRSWAKGWEDWDDLRDLMWLPTGAYVVVGGELLEGDAWLVDATGRAYLYDIDHDTAEYIPGAAAYSAEGVALRYSPAGAVDVLPVVL